jgi:NTE family protein
MTNKLGLVLSGGGAPAAYFGVGVVKAIEEAGLRPSLLSGVSAGAINACALGVGMNGDALARMWHDIRWYDIYRPRADVWNIVQLRRLFRFTTNPVDYLLNTLGWNWLLDTTPARQTLSRRLGGERLTPVDGTTVVVSAADSCDGAAVRFCNTLPPPHRRSPEFRLVDLTLDADYTHAQTSNTLAREAPGATERRQVSLLLIEPTELAFSVGGFLRFTAAQAKDIIEYGEQQGSKALAGWRS